MKGKHIIFIVLLILVADQALKLYIKLNYVFYEEHAVIGSWFKLNFLENPGMAYGTSIMEGPTGKLILTIFRLCAVVFGTWYLGHIIKTKQHKGFIICATLIYAGALGNLIDSTFYGLIFDKGMLWDPKAGMSGEYVPYEGVAAFSKHGYSSLFHGHVVDMLYFPIIKGAYWPQWVPFAGGDSFEFFRPVFNIADAAISTGVITLLLFQKRFFRQQKTEETHPTVETGAVVNDDVQIQ